MNWRRCWKRKTKKNGGTPLRLWWVYKFNFKFGAKIIKSSKWYFLIRNNEFQIINLSYTYFKYQVTSNKQTIRKKERKKTDYNPNNRSSETFRCVDLNKTWMLKKYTVCGFLYLNLYFNSFTTSFNSKDQKKNINNRKSKIYFPLHKTTFFYMSLFLPELRL